jgi:hypothetical protein
MPIESVAIMGGWQNCQPAGQIPIRLANLLSSTRSTDRISRAELGAYPTNPQLRPAPKARPERSLAWISLAACRT